MDDSSDFSTWLAVARAVHFASCLLAVGFCVFGQFIARPRKTWDPSVSRWILLTLTAALLSGFAWLVFVACQMSGQSISFHTLAIVWNQTRFGSLWKIRFLLWLAATLGAVGFVISRRPLLSFLAMIYSALLLASLAWTGHGQFGSPRGWHLAADAVHLLVAGCWPAGLLPFLLLLSKLRRCQDDASRDEISAMTRRFSAMSLVSVPLLILTGLINSRFLVGTVSNLWPMIYGRVLLLKVVVFTLMILLGSVNLLYLSPRLARGPAGDIAAARLARIVRVEIFLFAVVICLVAILGLLMPPRM